MGTAGVHEEDLESMTASVGTKEDLQGDKAAVILQKLASREADRRANLERQAASNRSDKFKLRGGYSKCSIHFIKAVTAVLLQLRASPARHSCSNLVSGSIQHRSNLMT